LEVSAVLLDDKVINIEMRSGFGKLKRKIRFVSKLQ